MTGLSFSEFYEKLYYGADIEFTLNKWHYMIYCGWDKNSGNAIHSIELVKSDQPFFDQTTSPKIWEEVFKKKMNDGNENIETFLQAKIFDQKSFYDVETDVVVNYS